MTMKSAFEKWYEENKESLENMSIPMVSAEWIFTSGYIDGLATGFKEQMARSKYAGSNYIS